MRSRDMTSIGHVRSNVAQIMLNIMLKVWKIRNVQLSQSTDTAPREIVPGVSWKGKVGQSQISHRL